MSLAQDRDRVHAIAGVSNFRDVGGIGLADKGRMTRGRLYRSAHLGDLAVEGARDLATLRIGAIIDLRGARERASAPSPPLATAGRIPVLEIGIEPRAAIRIRDLFLAGRATPCAVRAEMLTAYREFATIDASAFAAALQALSARIETPALIHCTAGKDRTGWLVALVQSFLGARHDAVLADYLATNVYWDRRAPLPADLDPEMTNALLDADASYLDAAFDMLARTQGSPARFVRRALGDEAAARLEAALTEQKCDP